MFDFEREEGPFGDLYLAQRLQLASQKLYGMIRTGTFNTQLPEDPQLIRTVLELEAVAVRLRERLVPKDRHDREPVVLTD